MSILQRCAVEEIGVIGPGYAIANAAGQQATENDGFGVYRFARHGA